MKPEKTALLLEELCKAYGEEKGAKDIYCLNEKGYLTCKITLEKLVVEFVYSLKGSELYPISTLSCRIYPDSSRPYHYEIQEIIDYLDIYDFHCYCFPYIESEKRLNACFNYITDFLSYHRDEILTLCDNAEEIKERKIEEIGRVYSYNDEDVAPDSASQDMFFSNIFNHYSQFCVQRYTTLEAYDAFVSGDFEKAYELYGKIEEKTGYEEKLVDFISEQYAYQAVPEECASILDVKKYRKSKTKDFVLTLVLSVVIFSGLFILIQALANAYYLSVSQFAHFINPLKAAVYGIIPGITGAIAFRQWLEPLTQKNKKEAEGFYDLLSNRKDTKRGFIITASLFVISVILFIGLCRPPIYVTDTELTFKKENKLIARYTHYPLSDFEEKIIIEGYYKDKNFIEYEKDPYMLYVFSGRRLVNTSKFGLSDEEIEKLSSILDPGMENYKTKSLPAIEDLI